jgi:hypothetical protein
MALLWLLALVACLVGAASLLTRLRVTPIVRVEERADPLGHIARHVARWRLAGVAGGLLAAVAVAGVDGLGVGLLLAAPAFALCVLAGVLVGEVTAVGPASTPTRGAALETRRAGDYLPVRLGGAVAAMAGVLGLLLVATSASAAADDLGRAGRELRQVCPDGMVAGGSPWPGSFYSVPLALTVLVGLLLAGAALRGVVGRSRAGLGADPELRALDDLVRRRAARAIVAACGVLISAPLAGTAVVAGGRLLVMPCTPAWATAAGWVLVALALGALVALAWCASGLLAPARQALHGIGAR